MEAGPKSQHVNKSAATGSLYLRRGINESTYTNPHIKFIDSPSLNLDGSSRNLYTTTTNNASMEASASAAFGELPKVGTRANDHPEIVDMTEVVMSIKSPSPSLLSLNQGNNPLPSPSDMVKEAQTNNGESILITNNEPKRATDLCLSSPSP